MTDIVPNTNELFSHGAKVEIELKDGPPRPGWVLGYVYKLDLGQRIVIQHPYEILHIYHPSQVREARP